MPDYRLSYIENKVMAGANTFSIKEGKMYVTCSDGFVFEVVPVMARSMTAFNTSTNETTTITKSSISVKLNRAEKRLEQTQIPGVR